MVTSTIDTELRPRLNTRHSCRVNPCTAGNLLFWQRLRSSECILDTIVINCNNENKAKNWHFEYYILSKITRVHHDELVTNKEIFLLTVFHEIDCNVRMSWQTSQVHYIILHVDLVHHDKHENTTCWSTWSPCCFLASPPPSPRTSGQKLILHETNKYELNEPVKGKETLWKLLNRTGWVAMTFLWNLHTPHDTPYLSTYLFIVKMKMYVYQTLQTIEINYITTGNRDMNIQTLVFI